MKKNLPPRERCQRWLLIHCLPWLIASSAYAQTATPITWQSAADAPISRYESEGIATGGKLYALGGFTDNTNHATNRCDAYDPATNTWTRLADMPEAVTHSGTAVDGNFLYLAGGFVGNHPGPITDHVWKYSINTNTWTAFVPLPAARGGGSVVRLGRELHYFGGVIRIRGFYSKDTPEHWALSLDDTLPTWKPKAPLPNPRNHLGGALLNGKIYAVGGQHLGKEGDDNQRSLHEYDPTSDTWTAKADMPRPLGHVASSVFPWNNRLVVVAGVTDGHKKVANIIEYDPTANTWTELTPLPVGRQSPVAGVINGKIVVNGGSYGPVHANTWIGTPAQGAPVITTLSPTHNATSAPRNANVSATFSQNVNAATASGAAIKIQGSQTGTLTLAGKGTFSGSGTKTITFNPTADFKAGEQVQVSITQNARNTGGTPLAKPQVVNFTAATAAAPLAFVPVSGQPAPTYGQAVADFDGDGDVDIAAGSKISALWLNDGSGHFATSKSLGLDTVYLLKAADLDGDGDVDLAAVVNTTAIALRFNDGRGNFSGSGSLDLVDPIHSLETGDFDGDGDVDLAGLTAKDYNGTEGGLTIRFNNGSGQFTGSGRLFVGLNPHEIRTADFDNDGDLDIACSNDNEGSEANRLYLAFNDGTGQFTSKADAYFNNQVVTSFAVGDLDRDGDIDLAVNQDEGDVYDVFGTIYTNNGSGSFKAGQVIGGTAGGMHLGDMDGDGDLDLLTTAYRPGSSFGLTLRLNNGSGVFSNSPVPLLSGTSGFGLNLADWDGDGTLDIANFPYVHLNNSGCSTTGSIRREYWANLPGNSLASIPVNAPPTAISQLTSLRTPANLADNYGQRLRGYLCAPTTGNYTFFIQGDDQVELYLSSDATAAQKQRIAWANVAWSWTANVAQQSALIRLVAGQRYYLEVLHKEASGLDQVVVGWRTPEMAASTAPVVIPGSVLSPAPAPNVVAPVDFREISIPSSDEILLTWYENNSEETGYVVERATAEEGPYLTVGTLGPQLYKYVDFQDTVGLQPNTTYFYRVYATSLLGPSPSSQVLSGTTYPCQATGTILREYWANVPGSSIVDIPVNTPPTSSSQLTILRTAAYAADNYGQRIRGYVCAPATGNFTFFIQGDDNAELYLSPDNDPAHKHLIASAKLAWNWTDNASQQSSPISLVAGRSYYLEVLHKEAGGGDQVRVGWRTPAMAANAEPVIILGSVLSPFVMPANARVASVELATTELVSDELTAAPNPFTEQTIIRFTTAATEQARLQVYDVQGRLVGNLFEGLSLAGEVHQLSFDGRRLSQGMYLIRLATAQKVSHHKLLLAR